MESPLYLINNICGYSKKNAISVSRGKCTPSIQSKGTTPIIFDIQFKSLAWIGNAENT